MADKKKSIAMTMHINTKLSDTEARAKIVQWKRAHLDYQERTGENITLNDWLIMLIDSQVDG